MSKENSRVRGVSVVMASPKGVSIQKNTLWIAALHFVSFAMTFTPHPPSATSPTRREVKYKLSQQV